MALHSISSWAAWAYCGSIAFGFVGALYALVPADIQRLGRDDPRQIRARFWASGSAAAMSLIALLLLFGDHFPQNAHFAEWVGLLPKRAIPTTLKSLLLAMLLFAGPFAVQAARCIAHPPPTLKDKVWALFPNAMHFRGVVFVRNIIVAPFIEELVFRCCTLPVYIMSGSKRIFPLALLFGLAHIHHHVVGSNNPWSVRIAGAVFQCTYTTLFGLGAMWILLRTGNLYAAFAVHAFCNAMGFPDVSFFQKSSLVFRYRFHLAFVYIAGIIAFAAFMGTLIETNGPLWEAYSSDGALQD